VNDLFGKVILPHTARDILGRAFKGSNEEVSIDIRKDRVGVCGKTMTLYFEGGAEEMTILGVPARILWKLAGLEGEMDGTTMRFRDKKFALDVETTQWLDEIPERPNSDKWRRIGDISHIRGLMSRTESCWWDIAGNISTHSTYATAATFRDIGHLREESYRAMNLLSDPLERILNAGVSERFSMDDKRLWLEGYGAYASIGKADIVSMGATPLVSLCEGYKKKAVIRMKAGGPTSGPVFFMSTRGIGIVRGAEGEWEFIVERGARDFEVSVDDIHGLGSLWKGSVAIFLPEQSNYPAGFRDGRNWYWTMATP